MLSIITNASSPVSASSKLPGKYAYSFWAANKNIVLVSDNPFSRNDLVRIEPSGRDDLFFIEQSKLEDLDKQDFSSLGFLVTLSTDIPLSPDVNYEFSTDYGDISYLSTQRTTFHNQVYYLLLCHVKSTNSRIVGQDSVHNDGGIEFIIDLNREFSEFMTVYNQVKDKS